MKARDFIRRTCGGIKQGLERKSFLCAVIWSLDRKIGKRGAFGKQVKPHLKRGRLFKETHGICGGNLRERCLR